MSTYDATPSSSRIPMASTSQTQAVVPFSQRERSLNRQVVLEEDEYTAALSHIIARDFFPSIQNLDATNEYLSALDSGDETRIKASVRQLEVLEDRTPLVSASTPLQTPIGSSRLGKKRTHEDVYGGYGLDYFQAKFTSEDNASFTEILDEENRKRKERWGWAYEAEEKAKRRALEWREKRIGMIEERKAEEQKLLTEAGEGSGKGKGKGVLKERSEEEGDEDDEASVLALVTEEDQAKALVTFATAEEPESKPWDPNNILSRPVDTRSTTVPTWNFTTRNALMFPPDVDTTPYGAPLPPPSAKPDGAPTGGEKVINHNNTRLAEYEDPPAPGEPASPSRSRISRAIRGSISALSIDSSSTADGPKGAYPLVDAIPSPSPDMLGPERLKQLMTWGTLAATPRALPSDGEQVGQAGQSPFTIAPPTPRDDLAHRLGTTASRSLREKAALYSSTPAASSVYDTPQTSRSTRSARSGTPRRQGSMPPPSFIPSARRESTLSPAARTLLTKAGGGKRDALGLGTAGSRRAEVMSKSGGWEGVGSGGGVSRTGGARWTPSPSPRRREA